MKRCGRRWPVIQVMPDTPIRLSREMPEAPEQIHILLDSKPAWVRVDDAGSEDRYERYPSESLEDWHRRHGLLEAD